MNLSMKWLADYVKIGAEPRKFCYDLTMTGSKVEGYEVEGSDIKNVVVGKLLSVVPHENSDHLLVCQVDVGKAEPIQIVTGASNVKAGDLVPVALDGSDLPGGVHIKKGKLRGVESNGMLCSLGELKLTKHDFPYAIEDGIFIIQEDCKPGDDIHDAIGLNDTSVEFEITPNRPDCLSVIGLAREAAATYCLPFDPPEPKYKGISGDIGEFLNVTVENDTLCKRYIGGVVRNVKIEPSPRWLRERLRASGVRPINNLVDITNYVMLEYGQPMHAFDARYVSGHEIHVRNAKAGETITTLDGAVRELSPEMLVIADAEKPVAVAGVMGGEYSGIMDDTVDVIFESACFDGASVRRTAKKLGMRTDSSARFEKGLDPKGCMPAILRAFELVELLKCGEPLDKVIDKGDRSRERKTVDFDPKWINRFLGTDISREDMIGYLERIGFEVVLNKVVVPSFRVDIECKADVAEEVARFYGYNNIVGAELTGVANAKLTPKQKLLRKIEAACTALGLYEIETFSFISPKYYDKINLPADSKLRSGVTITNPLGEDTSVMRTTVMPSLCEVLARNYNYRNPSAAIFELGSEYIPTEEGKLPVEPVRLSIGLYGNSADFYTVKGIIEGIFGSLGIDGVEYEAAAEGCGFDELSMFHPGRVAVAKINGKPLAILGEMHPAVAENYGIGTRTYCAKLNVAELLDLETAERTYKPLPKYPAATRDISLVCDDDVPVASLEKLIRGAVGAVLEKITLFDVYKGEQIAGGRKSVAFSIVMRSADGTLTDEQADACMKRVRKALDGAGAEVR